MTDAVIPPLRESLLLVNIERADMDITAIQTQGKIELAKFRELPTLIKSCDESQRKSFAESIADKLLNRKLADDEVDIVIDTLVDLAINYEPVDRFAVAFRKRWSA